MMAKSKWAKTVLVALCMLPTAAVVRSALADEGDDDGNGADDGTPDETPAAQLSKRRRAVLAKIASDETVLINVQTRDMPSSPDILNLGRRGTKALARCLADNVEDRLRRTCATLLGRIGDKAALPALHGALEAWDPGVRRAAVDALRAIPDGSSFEPLKKLWERPEEQDDVRSAVLAALGALGDTRAMKLLREVATKPPAEAHTDFRVPAFSALWRSRHLMAKSTLIGDVKGALASGDVPLQQHATFYAAELRAPELASALEALMQSPDMHVRNRAVYALGRIGDKNAIKTLLAQVPKVREARMLNNIAFALDRLDSKSFFSTIATLVDHKQAAIRMNATFVLGDVKRSESLPFLTKALADKNDFVRSSAVAAIAKLELPEGVKALEPLLGDASPGLREQAIYAVDALTKGGRSDLVFDKLWSSDKPARKKAAGEHLARAGDLRVADWAIGCFESHACGVATIETLARGGKAPKIPGRLLVSWTKGRPELTDLLAELRPTGTGAIAVASLDAAVAHDDFRQTATLVDMLGELHESAAPAPLRTLLAHENARLRLRAAVALARLDAVDADKVILAELDAAPADRLPGVVRMVRKIAEKPARDRLTPALIEREKSADVRIAMAAAAIHLAWDPETAAFRLLDALASSSTLERDLADAYLRRDERPLVTAVLRRMLARETRESTRDRLRKILDAREPDGAR
jgi:HEAT repeat protein